MLSENLFISLMPRSLNLRCDEKGRRRVIHTPVILTMKFIKIKFLRSMPTSQPVPVSALGLGFFCFLQ